MSEDPRAEALATLSRFVVAELSLGEMLEEVATVAVKAIEGAEIAGISMLDLNGQAKTRVYTDETSPEIGPIPI